MSQKWNVFLLDGTVKNVAADYCFIEHGNLVFGTGTRSRTEANVVAIFAAGQWVRCIFQKE
jgi:hypothetical protein